MDLEGNVIGISLSTKKDKRKQRDTKFGYYTGLSDEEVIRSRQLYGINILTPPKKKSVWLLFWEKFNDPIIKILLVALFLSVGVSIYQYISGQEGKGVFFEPAGIFTALMLATVIGFAVEQNANKKFEILNQANDDTLLKVVRNNRICEVSKKDIVVGDIVIIEAGEEIPADGILLEAVSLQINESTLTGEPVITKTTVEVDFDKEATYPSNEVLKGTVIVGGHGVFQVEKVGDATEYGKVYVGSQIENDTATPLNKQLGKLGHLITIASFSIAALIVIVRLVLFFTKNLDANILYSGSYILETLMIAITLIVVSVPEGLPMSIVLSLALSMKRMLATNNLVRKMHASETMGAVSVICTDKTGTLTKNQMEVVEINFYGLEKNQELKGIIEEGLSVNTTAYLNIENQTKIKALGNPTEGALLLWLNKGNVNYLSLRENAEVIEQMPFSTERKYMATIVNSPIIGKRVLYVKGAPEIVLAESKNVFTEKGLIPVREYKKQIDEQLLAYQKQAMRTLAFAYQILEDTVHIRCDALQDADLIFCGIAAISDPVREDVPEAISQCMEAGISVKIVTGDTPATATEIGRQIGLWLPSDTSYNRITGTEFASLSDEELSDRVLDLKIISRARPMDKERLVRLLQKKGQVVAVTGDGTNDAPALNAAQVGLSMGDGTTVAKEASSITILDNSFASIARAVMWGRSLYQNIQRFLLFQLTINVAACLIILLGVFLDTESPLTITQMLWVNLIMDTFAALALASLPPNGKVMRDKPRKPEDFIVTCRMGVSIAGVGLLFVFLLFGVLQYFKYYDSEFNLRDFFTSYLRTGESLPHALSYYELTIFFTVFVMFQVWNLFNVKAFATAKPSIWNIKESKVFWMVAFAILAGQVTIVNFGGKMFSVESLPLTDWLYIIVATSFVLWIGELFRFIKYRLLKIGQNNG